MALDGIWAIAIKMQMQQNGIGRHLGDCHPSANAFKCHLKALGQLPPNDLSAMPPTGNMANCFVA